MFLTTGSSKHRTQLATLRAEAWAEGLSGDQFVKRNEMLYDHPFGQSRIETHVYLDGTGAILSSCDTLDIDFATQDDKGGYAEERGLLLASVFTPKERRGQGHASKMLKELFETQADKSWCLYSDIPPKFYERFNFFATPVAEITEIIPTYESTEARLVEPEAVPMEEAVRVIRQWRTDLVQSGGPGLALLPDPQWVDWELLKFGFFAELKSKPMPEVCYQVGDEFAIVVPDFAKGEIKILFATDVGAARRAAQLVSHATGIKKFFTWKLSDEPSPGASVPMAWSLKYPNSTRFVDLQYGDWW